MITGKLPWSEKGFENNFRVVGFMQGEDSIGGPIQSVALQHLFQQERGTAPPSSGGGSSGSSGGHTQHTHHTEDLFQKCFEETIQQEQVQPPFSRPTRFLTSNDGTPIKKFTGEEAVKHWKRWLGHEVAYGIIINKNKKII